MVLNIQKQILKIKQPQLLEVLYISKYRDLGPNINKMRKENEMTMPLNLNNMRYISIFLLINLLVCIMGCKNGNIIPLNQKKDLTLLANKKKHSIEKDTLKEELLFKRWLKDTLLVLKQDKSFKSNDDIITVNSKYLSVYTDSLSFEIRTVIDDTIDFKIKYPIKTWIGGTLYNLESKKVNLPQKPYELKIDVVEMYGLSSSKNLIREKNYEYNYISVRPLDSKYETYYSLI